MATLYTVGDKPIITGTFTQAGVATDPVEVRGMYKDPSGNVTTLTYGTDPEITKSATGVYTFKIPLDEAGLWWYRMDDNGANVATESYFNVSSNVV